MAATTRPLLAAKTSVIIGKRSIYLKNQFVMNKGINIFKNLPRKAEASSVEKADGPW
jgi:hypothetical protein